MMFINKHALTIAKYLHIFIYTSVCVCVYSKAYTVSYKRLVQTN